jgi:peptide/nickel transport system substrate-binding protein/oligopeptide transport system substrate-binding protein
MTWIGDFLDPLTFLQLWTSKSNLNDAGYNNPEYDKLIEEAIPEKDKKRLEKFAQAESLLLSQAVVLPLSNQPSFNLINIKQLVGWYPNLLDIHPFKYLHFKEPRVFPNLVRNSFIAKPQFALVF